MITCFGTIAAEEPTAPRRTQTVYLPQIELRQPNNIVRFVPPIVMFTNSLTVLLIILLFAVELPWTAASGANKKELFLRAQREDKQDGQNSPTSQLKSSLRDSCPKKLDKNGNKHSCWRNDDGLICIVLFKTIDDGIDDVVDHSIPQNGDRIMQEWCWDGADTYTHAVPNIFERSNKISAAAYESKLREFCLDKDGDMYCDPVDTCPDVSNPGQEKFFCSQQVKEDIDNGIGDILKNGTALSLQTVSSGGTLVDGDGDELNITSAENITFTPLGSTCTVDGVEVECGKSNCVTRGTTGKKSFVVQKNCTTGVVQTVVTVDESGRTTELILVNEENGVYITITSDGK